MQKGLQGITGDLPKLSYNLERKLDGLEPRVIPISPTPKTGLQFPKFKIRLVKLLFQSFSGEDR